MSSIKTGDLEINNDLTSSGILDFSNGYLFKGESYTENIEDKSN